MMPLSFMGLREVYENSVSSLAILQYTRSMVKDGIPPFQ
jgi:hypothetical protein